MSGYLKKIPSSTNYSCNSFPFRHNGGFTDNSNCIIASTSQWEQFSCEITSSVDLGM